MKHLGLVVILFSVWGSIRAQGLFVETAQQAGITQTHRSSLHIGGGVAIFDMDNDDHEDIYLTGGEFRDHLYRNNGDATFTEIGVDAGTGITASMTTHGVATADIDNDGFRDLLVLTEMGNENIFFRNNGNSTFTRLVGVFDAPTDQRAMSASFGDVNKDGFLDVYIVNYVEFPEVILNDSDEVVGFAHGCYKDLLFINNGDLTFTESSALYGTDNGGCGLAAAFTDLNNDGNSDLLVVNDFGEWVQPNATYVNQFPEPFFSDASEAMGTNAQMYGMGVAIGDYDRDGDLDYYMTNIGTNFLFRNDGAYFTSAEEAAGVENDSLNGLNTTSWGTFFFDYDNDGLLDLFVANGEIPAAYFIANVQDDPDKLFHNNGDGTFTDVTEQTGLGSVKRGRGAAFGDFDNDGLLDIVVNNIIELQGDTGALLYMNATMNENHWLKVRVRGVESNRDGFGSRVRVVANAISQLLEVDGGSSHASHNSSVAHFGLGEHALADSVIVIFPSGIERIMTNVQADQTILIEEDEVTSEMEERSLCEIKQVGLREFVLPCPTSGTVQLEVIDMLGRTVAKQSVASSRVRVDDDLQGIFIFRLHAEKYTSSKILILQ